MTRRWPSSCGSPGRSANSVSDGPAYRFRIRVASSTSASSRPPGRRATPPGRPRSRAGFVVSRLCNGLAWASGTAIWDGASGSRCPGACARCAPCPEPTSCSGCVERSRRLVRRPLASETRRTRRRPRRRHAHGERPHCRLSAAMTGFAVAREGAIMPPVSREDGRGLDANGAERRRRLGRARLRGRGCSLRGDVTAQKAPDRQAHEERPDDRADVRELAGDCEADRAERDHRDPEAAGTHHRASSWRAFRSLR
jgi:hypothetical protein